MNSPISTLSRLQRWYKSNCDGDWEHSYGIDIGNLDNPGWTVKINLDDTPLANVPFQQAVHGEEDDNFDEDGRQIGPWWTCKVQEIFKSDEENGKQYRKGLFWTAYCGPDSLEQVLTIFLDWAETSSPFG